MTVMSTSSRMPMPSAISLPAPTRPSLRRATASTKRAKAAPALVIYKFAAHLGTTSLLNYDEIFVNAAAMVSSHASSSTSSTSSKSGASRVTRNKITKTTSTAGKKNLRSTTTAKIKTARKNKIVFATSYCSTEQNGDPDPSYCIRSKKPEDQPEPGMTGSQKMFDECVLTSDVNTDDPAKIMELQLDSGGKRTTRCSSISSSVGSSSSVNDEMHMQSQEQEYNQVVLEKDGDEQLPNAKIGKRETRKKTKYSRAPKKCPQLMLRSRKI
ncbi:unnamed protein product [Amoebophrya sp. A120]|nr:unnamed protein product [Amoebophrya sp. A120]|eukprot:GSA120T00009738001.1